MRYFKILMDLDKNIWIIGMEKIINFPSYKLIFWFCPSTALICHIILKFDGLKLTCFNNVYDAELKKQNYDPRSYDYYQKLTK